jgi:hypothetical protein
VGAPALFSDTDSPILYDVMFAFSGVINPGVCFGAVGNWESFLSSLLPCC